MKNYLERKAEVTELQSVINNHFIKYREKMVKYYTLCHAPNADKDRLRRAQSHSELTLIACEIEVSLNRQIDGLLSQLKQLEHAINGIDKLLKTLDD